MSVESPQRRRDNWVEGILAIVLSAAGLMTSYASYQANLWSGDQAASYSRAGGLRVMSTRAAAEADTLRSAELSLFSSWLGAKAAGNDALAEFYAARLPSEFKPAFHGWLALKPLTNPEAPPSPFAMPNYVQPALQRARALEARADATFTRGETANDISDAFVQGAVILAMAMFFSGVCQVFRVPWVRLILLTIALVSCGVGLARILTLPVQTPGWIGF